MTDAEFQAERQLSLQLLRDYAQIEHRTQKDWAPILDAYRNAKHLFVFELDFACDPALHQALLDIRAELHALQALKTLQSHDGTAPHAAAIKMTAQLCLMQAGANEDASASSAQDHIKRRVTIWKNIFKDVDGFDEALVQVEEMWRKLRPPARPPADHDPDEVVRTFQVPGKCGVTNFQEEREEPYLGIPQGLLEPVNAFCQDYLHRTSFDISPDGAHWLITQAGGENEHEHLEDLKGQLSDGWGENLETYSILVGRNKVSPGWDSAAAIVLDGTKLATLPRRRPTQP